MTTISAQTILSSDLSKTGIRLTTLLLRYPRWIHAEVRTHRLHRTTEDLTEAALDTLAGTTRVVEAPTESLMECEDVSRNAGSSRAVPINRMIASVRRDPAVPIHWGKAQKGMQADEEHDAPVHIEFMGQEMILSREDAVAWHREASIALAQGFSDAGYHKQLANRYLEAHDHITVLVSATNWTNFLAQRDHKDAEPHMRELARQMRIELEKPAMQVLKSGEWHTPFITDEDMVDLSESERVIKSSACNASTSYKTVEGFDMTIDVAKRIYGDLLGGDLLHASPGEHVAKADFWNLHPLNPKLRVWQNQHEHGNFTGFRQHRKMLPNECH